MSIGLLRGGDGVRMKNAGTNASLWEGLAFTGPQLLRAYWAVRKWRIVSTLSCFAFDEVWDLTGHLYVPQVQANLLRGFETPPLFEHDDGASKIAFLEMWEDGQRPNIRLDSGLYLPHFRFVAGDGAVSEGVDSGTPLDPAVATLTCLGASCDLFGSAGVSGSVAMTPHELW